MSELIPYTEVRRDQLERMLAEEANKINMEERRNNGMRVILYLMLREGLLSIYCEDERTHSSAEYPVEPYEAYEWFNHAFAHPDANLPIYEQGENDG